MEDGKLRYVEDEIRKADRILRETHAEESAKWAERLVEAKVKVQV